MKKIALGFFVLFGSAVHAETGDYKIIVDQMRQLERDYPDVVAVFSIGNNQDGVPLYAMRISTTPAQVDLKKIAHIVVGTHHGNERHAPLSAMHLARELVREYRSPLLWQSQLNFTEFVVLPVLNVSGYNRSNRNEAGRDPNRNYAGPCHSGGPTLGSTQMLVNYLTTRPFTASITIHGYIGVLAYPWGFSTSQVRTRDHSLYDSITKQAASHNGYRYGTSTDTIYPAAGTYEDFVYWKHGMWSLLVELYDGSARDLDDTTDAMLAFFENVNSSPSVNNQHDGRCTRSIMLDLHNE